uniref:Sugar ABC transporter ATP-binding protein n=2 Tax=Alloyangia mangrovi TaxID=1779329 RepID=A0A2A3JY39_9RHOB
MPILSLKDIGKHYGGVTALSGVSFDVAPGEVVALAGDNGAGKSTMIKIISGIIAADEGQILFDGKPATMSAPQDANDLGIQTVYQDLALCDNLDTVQNLFLGRELSGGWRSFFRLSRPLMEKRAHEELERLNVKIRDYSTPVGSLSGGQRQSVAIARAVMSRPKVILLDEPTAALGVAQRAEVSALIERLRGQGLGIILVSHDLADVLNVADRVVVLRLGEKVADKPISEWNRSSLVAAITGVAA